MKLYILVFALAAALGSLHAEEKKDALVIAGAVYRPTSIEISEPISVSEAAERAGGTVPRIWWSEFTIIRAESEILTATYHYNLRSLSEDERTSKMKKIKVKSGDRLWFKEIVD